MADKTERIEDIHVGERVMATDPTTGETGRIDLNRPRKVVDGAPGVSP